MTPFLLFSSISLDVRNKAGLDDEMERRCPVAQIVLNSDQARVLDQATTPVEVCDELGRVLVRIPAPSEEQILERIRRERGSNVLRYPAEQVEARLRRLEEIRQQGGMDETKMRDLLRRMRAGEQV
jgi:hypothetical protein